MKRMTSLLTLIAFTGAVSAQDIFFSKEEIIDDMILPGLVEGLCTQDLMECLELSSENCQKTAEKTFHDSCSSPIPEDGSSDPAFIMELASESAACVSSAVVNSHKEKLVKNINSTACQALIN